MTRFNFYVGVNTSAPTLACAQVGDEHLTAVGQGVVEEATEQQRACTRA